MSRPLLDHFPVASISRRAGVVSFSGDLVVDDLGDFVWFGLPGSSCRGWLQVTSVHPVSLLYELLAGPVLLVEVRFGLDLGLLVSLSRFFVVFGV